MDTLYARDIVSIEPQDMGGPIKQRSEGFDAVKKKSEWWESNHEVHSGKAEGPWPHGDRFIVHFQYEVTPKNGPMAGKRMKLDETGLYTVKNGKVTQEEFFYHMG